MPIRQKDIAALVKRAAEDYNGIESSYNADLNRKQISPDLKIDIKNMCGNLRSALDYVASDIRDTCCSTAQEGQKFYFPIIDRPEQFQKKMDSWYPGLKCSHSELWSYLESIQPYHGNYEWLKHFNELNNLKKHDKLVEQIRTETHHIEAKSATGQAAWDPSATRFGPGAFINGVPVNPETQLPIPSSSQTVTETIWVDFTFEGMGISALGLLKKSVNEIPLIVARVQQWL